MNLEGGAYDIIVVDDGSPVPLTAVCDEFGPTVRCVRQANTGPASARNTGARVSEAEFLAFTDDDCRPRPDWIVTLLAAHQRNGNRLVGGKVVNALHQNSFSEASQTLCRFLYDYFLTSNGDQQFFTSNNMGCLRQDFLAIGGFDETFPLPAAEDRDFCMRWRDANGDLVYVDAAVVDHFHHLNLQRYWQQHSNYGRGARYLHAALDRRGDDRPKVERLSFYMELLRYPLKTAPARRKRQSALMVLSQCAMVFGYGKQMMIERRGRSLDPKREVNSLSDRANL